MSPYLSSRRRSSPGRRVSLSTLARGLLTGASLMFSPVIAVLLLAVAVLFLREVS